MSIKAIDSQIMVARTADFSRDTSALQKKPEIAQDYLAFREKINDAQDQTRVAKSLDSRKQELRTGDEGGGSAGYDGGGGSGSGEGDKDDEPAPNMFVPPGNSIIDIIV